MQPRTVEGRGLRPHQGVESHLRFLEYYHRLRDVLDEIRVTESLG